MAGDRPLRLARAWFDEATVANVFEPLIADWQRECAALAGARAFACRCSGLAAFVMTFALTFVRALSRPLPVGLGGNAWLCVETCSAIGALALTLLYAYGSGPTRGLTLGWIFPSSLAVALPLALAPAAVLLLRGQQWRPHEVRRALVRTAAVAMVAMLPLVGWIVPYANQQWREVRVSARAASPQNRQPLPRLERELTIPELVSPAGHSEALAVSNRMRAFELQTRLSIIVMPLCALALGLAVARPRATVWRALACWAGCASAWLYLLAFARMRYRVGIDDPAFAAWMPVIAIMLVALALGLARQGTEKGVGPDFHISA